MQTLASELTNPVTQHPAQPPTVALEPSMVRTMAQADGVVICLVTDEARGEREREREREREYIYDIIHAIVHYVTLEGERERVRESGREGQRDRERERQRGREAERPLCREGEGERWTTGRLAWRRLASPSRSRRR